MRREGQPVGVLSIQSYTPDAYTQEDLRTLQALADYCAGALERIRAEQACSSARSSTAPSWPRPWTDSSPLILPLTRAAPSSR